MWSTCALKCVCVCVCLFSLFNPNTSTCVFALCVWCRCCCYKIPFSFHSTQEKKKEGKSTQWLHKWEIYVVRENGGAFFFFFIQPECYTAATNLRDGVDDQQYSIGVFFFACCFLWSLQELSKEKNGHKKKGTKWSNQHNKKKGEGLRSACATPPHLRTRSHVYHTLLLSLSLFAFLSFFFFFLTTVLMMQPLHFTSHCLSEAPPLKRTNHQNTFFFLEVRTTLSQHKSAHH